MGGVGRGEASFSLSPPLPSPPQPTQPPPGGLVCLVITWHYSLSRHHGGENMNNFEHNCCNLENLYHGGLCLHLGFIISTDVATAIEEPLYIWEPEKDKILHHSV